MFHKSPRWTLTLGRYGFGFPLWKRGSGGFAGRRHRREDRVDDSIQLLQDFPVGKPQHPQVLRFQVSRAPLIPPCLRCFQVLAAVHLL